MCSFLLEICLCHNSLFLSRVFPVYFISLSCVILLLSLSLSLSLTLVMSTSIVDSGYKWFYRVYLHGGHLTLLDGSLVLDGLV